MKYNYRTHAFLPPKGRVTFCRMKAEHAVAIVIGPDGVTCDRCLGAMEKTPQGAI